MRDLRDLQRYFSKESEVYRMFLDYTRDYLKHYDLENYKEDKAVALVKEVLAHAESEDWEAKAVDWEQFELEFSAICARLF